ncbi:hypothetical protein YC2023_069289 [Brassica napus]
MEPALTDICEIIEENPINFSENLVWICRQCPHESASVSRSHLNALLAVARIISRNVDTSENHGKLAVLDFLHAVPSSFRRSFWPCSFTLESITEFYCAFLGYVSCLTHEFGSEVVEITEEAIGDDVDVDPAISRAFLVALSHNGFPSIQQSDGDELITMLLHQFSTNEKFSPDLEVASKGSFSVFRQQVASFEDESVESLENQEITFKLMAHVLDKVKVDSKLYDQLSCIAWRQLKSMSAFLKSRKQDWNDQDSVLKTRVDAKLFVYQAAAKMKIKSLVSLETDGKTYKKLAMETLTLLFDAAEACLTSVWRKMKVCEELFISLLCGISEMAVAKGRCLPHGLFVRLKPLVLAVCAQPDTWVGREREVPTIPLNVVRLLADISVAVKKPEVADMVFPFFIESLEEGDTSTPCSLRLQLLDAVSRIATLGFEKSYRETVVLMTRGYLREILTVVSVESKTSEPTSRKEHVETLAAGFLTIANGLMKTKLRADYRHLLLSLCSDVSLASESKSGGSGADMLGPLLPAVAEICSDLDPTSNVEPSLLKLFRNLWFYIALFGLAPPIVKPQPAGGPYMWNTQWSLAVQRISQGTPPLVVSSVKWLEDEFELNALRSSDSSRGIGNKKVASTQRTALAIALGGRVEVSALNTISGPTYAMWAKATYLLAVAILEIIRFTSNGGILNGGSSVSASRSAFSCAFEYLKSPNLTHAVSQCLTAIVHRAFQAAISWLEDRISLTGKDDSIRESTMNAHACFLIKNMSQRDEHIRDISVKLLNQIRDKFPQILWSSSCLDSLLFSVHDNAPSTVVNDPAWTAAGLLQDKLCKANTLQRTQTTTDVVSLLNEIKIGTGENEIWSGAKTANIPAVMDAAVAASGENLKASEAFNLEILGSGFVNAMYKCKHTGQISGLVRLGNSIGNDTLINSSVRSLQQIVNTSTNGGITDKSQFRETCSQATAVLLSNLQAGEPKTDIKGSSRLLRLLCWSPAYILTPDAMETGVFIWTWLVSAAPQLGSLVLAELVDAWTWTIDSKRGLFASDVRYYGPAAKLKPQLAPGEPEESPDSDPVDQIVAHRLWLGFLIDRFEVRLYAKYITHSNCMSFGIVAWSNSCCLVGCYNGVQVLTGALPTTRQRLGFFRMVFSSARVYLLNERSDFSQSDSNEIAHENGKLAELIVWGKMDNYAVGKEKRKQLLLILCQHESDRLDVWAQPICSKDSPYSRLKVSSGKWTEHAKTAFLVDPRIAISLVSRFPANIALKSEVTQLVQAHIVDLRSIPEALPYFLTPKTVEENSVLLQQLPHWAACSITQALEFLTPNYKGHPRVMAYVLRVLESYPPERVTFFMPQLVQSLRYDEGRLVEGYLLRAAQRSDIFAHILTWHLQGESFQETVKDGAFDKNASFQAILSEVRQHIIDGFTPKALDLFNREFDFFEKVTSISGVLFPLPKEERRAGIRRELEKIKMQGEDLYLPTAPNKLVKGIQIDSGIPLQSAAKVPIMITFNVVDRDGNHNDVKPQACIFKVGDDCRQDVLALQVISLLRDIFEAVGLNLYLFPYGVLPTGAGRGIIEVVPNTRSRSQMGESTDGGLYEIFQQEFGPVGSPSFETARGNFLTSSAGYAVASLLLQPKDRHNGNLLFDNMGRLVHIDFGFIFETSPGGNMRFESAHFKLSHEMTQLLDPSGDMKSETWHQFGYLAARRYMEGIISTVEMMVESGLPCFSRGNPIEKLRKRFHPEMSEREAAHFMINVCTDAYNKWTTFGYDLIQYLQQGIEK